MLTPGVAYDSRTGRRILLATVLGSSLVMLDATVVNVALPAIGRDLGGGIGGLQSGVDGFPLKRAAHACRAHSAGRLARRSVRSAAHLRHWHGVVRGRVVAVRAGS